MAVQDVPRDFIGFIRDQGLVEKALQRHIGQGKPCRGPLLVTGGGQPGQRIAGPKRARRSEQFLEAGEGVCPRSDRVAESARHGKAGIAGSMPRSAASGWRRCTRSRTVSTRDAGTSTMSRMCPDAISREKLSSRELGTDAPTMLATQAPNAAQMSMLSR